MIQIDITRLSSKGQIVIPAELRKDMKEGEKILIIRDNDKIILKKTDSMDKNLKEDLEFARRTEEAWKEIEQGKGKSYTLEEFHKHLKNG
jgi:AbrB family looped-hinge helix DNA binding protein